MASHHHHHGHAHDHAALPSSVPPDPAAESLSAALRAGFNVLRVVMLVLLVAYVFSGWFQVNPGEQGLIVRLGHLRENQSDSGLPSRYLFGPGSHGSLPDPFDTKIRLPGVANKIEISTFCFPRSAEQIKQQQPLAKITPAMDRISPVDHGSMFSGDRNLSHGVFTIEYQIENGEQFVRNVGESVGEFQPMLARLTENAVVRSVAGMRVERILRRDTAENPADFTVEIQKRLNEQMTNLHTGVVISKVSADTVEPGRVRQAFIEESNARAGATGLINEAQAEKSRILGAAAGPPEAHEKLLKTIDEYGALQEPKDSGKPADEAGLAALRVDIDQQLNTSKGEVSRILDEARSRANEVRERVRREFEEFTYYLAAYKRFPKLTAVRLWVRMRDEILASEENEIFFVPPNADEVEIITNRDPQKAIDADKRRMRARSGGGGP